MTRDSGIDAAASLAERFRVHFGDASHLYAHLLRAMADDLDAGGVVSEICADWVEAPERAMVQLRLLAGLFRVVLRGEARELEPFYPCLGGRADPASAWPQVRDVLVRHQDEMRAALEVAPQTNEPGRSAALLVGLFEAVRRSGLTRVRLLEPGASAGLNLLLDRFRFATTTWTWGADTSPLTMRDVVEGEVSPVAFEISSRRGCDLAPVDVSSAEGRLRLRSFVWPHHVERHERLAAALEVAAASPVPVDRASAGEWLERELAELPSDQLTVVWHSITGMYWPAEETGRVADAVAAARSRGPLARVEMEYPPGAATSAVLSVDGEVLATVADHGIPVRMLPART